MLSRRVAGYILVVTILGGSASTVAASAPAVTERGVAVTETRSHRAMDATGGPPPAWLQPGTRPRSLTSPRAPAAATAHQLPSQASNSSAREVLGFAQSGEISSGAWRSDLRFDLLTTIAYFGINMNSDGSMFNSDAGFAVWQSQSATDLINAAHAAGDRVVLVVKTFDNATIASITGSEVHRQAAINSIVSQLATRSADGVNIDFEGTDSSVAANLTQFIAELRSALYARLPNASYLTIDTYASAAAGGTCAPGGPDGF